MLAPVASPSRTLPMPRRSPLVVHKKQAMPRPIRAVRERSTTTRRGSLMMARIALLFLTGIACILMFSRTLLPEADYFYVSQEIPLEMEQGLPTGGASARLEVNKETNANKQKQNPFNHTTRIRATRPRVLLLELDDLNWSTSSRTVTRMRSTYNQTVSKRRFVLKYRRPFLHDCVPMADWQTRFYPTCNSLHELDLAAQDEYHSTMNNDTNSSSSIQLLGEGGSWRMAWKYFEESHNSTAALKMLHTHRQFDDESFGHAITDAIAMERLTHSVHTIDLFQFCGQSVLTEWAPGSARDLIKHPKLDTLHRLKLARDLTLGLADVHSIGNQTSFCHNDINVANMVQTQDGRIKYNDFNVGFMLRVQKETGKPCGFPVEFNSPLWRAPEEVLNQTYVSEKVDVYSLGNVLFQILTKHQPWSWLEPNGRPPLDQVGMRKTKGELPFLPEKYRNNTRLEVLALRYAYQACFTLDPRQRPSAAKLSKALTKVLQWKKKKRKVKPDELRKLFGLV